MTSPVYMTRMSVSSNSGSNGRTGASQPDGKRQQGGLNHSASERVVVELDYIQITSGPDLAFAHALVTYQGMSADGQRLRAMQNRLTWPLHYRRGAGKSSTNTPPPRSTRKRAR